MDSVSRRAFLRADLLAGDHEVVVRATPTAGGRTVEVRRPLTVA